eukprot:TRINITY_DN3388_c0_g5_i1.p1 TRINITY_DN3388_c0_g5~~TRINITY_DN3388_c0_g5_i1.p1  ORF type:complete len:354 (-),score=139.42 TRINITY_DN3388_c0_g5_i1:718-1779(-)
MKELEAKRIRIKELELICSELSDEIRLLSGQLRSLDFIQRQDNALKKRLSISYMRFNSAKEGIDLSSPVFKNQLRSTLADKTPDPTYAQEEGFSLAKDIALNRCSTTKGTGTSDSSASERSSEMIKKEKTRMSDMFQAGEYFQDKFRKELEIIEEDEDKSFVHSSAGEKPSVVESSTRGDSIFQKSASTVKAESLEENKNEGKEIAVGTEGSAEVRKTGVMTEATKKLLLRFATKIKEQNKRISEVLGTAGIDMRPSKISTFDFLTLRKDEKIAKILSVLKEPKSGIIFSDYIYIIKEDSGKVKQILYVTEYTIFVLNVTNYEVVQSTPIEDLSIFIIVKTSGTLVAFHFEKA